MADSTNEGMEYNGIYVDAASEIAKLAEILENARPQTVEEWEEAYDTLLADYRKLHDAAENVTTIALPPGMCAPTSRDEDGNTRMIVATRALDELHEVLYEQL